MLWQTMIVYMYPRTAWRLQLWTELVKGSEMQIGSQTLELRNFETNPTSKSCLLHLLFLSKSVIPMHCVAATSNVARSSLGKTQYLVGFPIP